MTMACIQCEGVLDALWQTFYQSKRLFQQPESLSMWVGTLYNIVYIFLLSCKNIYILMYVNLWSEICILTIFWALHFYFLDCDIL